MTAEVDPVTFEVLRHRLLAVNDEATFTIMQVSANMIATDSNDLNSALMTAEGEVVVFGVWILVHSCSINTMVRRILDDYADNPGIGPGDMFISNDPFVTGRHQLDVVVVAPVFFDGRLVAWTGTIVHQNDVGGPVAGGFAVGARDIYGEAMPMVPMKIVEGGVVRRDVEREYLIRSRNPELNRLDLLAQIAANRVHGQRVVELCHHYGSDRFTATLDRLLDSTEARLRARLSELPDGRWRHVSLMEHDGVVDAVYRIALTMSKRGGHLELDFTDSSSQAQGMVNAPHGTLRCFSIVALLVLLGFDDMPWVPGAFERVVTFVTTEGTVTHARWPAGVSMAGTAAGQAIRTVVQQCLAEMVDASDRWEGKVMTSGMTSAPGTAISGFNRRGERFSAILVDAQLGGGGARRFADGVDTAGLLHSPGATTSNVEVNERNYPVLYLHRTERPDSGGPGATRGGVGAEHALVLRPPSERLDLVLFAHGVQQPTSSGFAGGEPGLQNGFLIERATAAGTVDVAGLVRGAGAGGHWEVPPPKHLTSLGAGDVFTSWCAGGGGMGDPIERDPDLVRGDVEEGLVTVAGAARDYAVVVSPEPEPEPEGGWTVDASATEAMRLARRRERLGGADPVPAADGPPPGRRVGTTLVLIGAGDDRRFACRRCGHGLCGAAEDVKAALVLSESPAWERWPLSAAYEGARRFVVRRFYCPSCARQLFVEVNLAGEPPVRSLELLD